MNLRSVTRNPQSSAACPLCGSQETGLFCHAFDHVRWTPEERWEILWCRDCGYGWTHPPLEPEKIGTYYPPAYLGNTSQMIDDYRQGRLQKSRSWRKETEKVGLIEQFKTGGRILDVGCADARFLLALDGNRWDRTGVELSEPTVALVSEVFPKLTLIAGDIYSPRLTPSSFDVVTFWHVLEHLPEPEKVLRRVKELLRPGGLVFISLPNLDSLQALWFRRFWYGFDDVPRHLHHFSPRSLQRILSEAGLEFLHGPLFFSRIVNFHCLKWSLINWSREKFGTRGPYYALKPLLFVFELVESLTRSAGIITVVAAREIGRDHRRLEASGPS
ncbi:MAG: class I SAM-dependent methyltransferase [Acidobacteria bacterium]|nr:MAG: class I SAM-dependent methyltransferase [Acidobacteriota bacterium]